MPTQSVELITIVLQERWRRQALSTVAALVLPDCWIGAGFVRAPVWDQQHGYKTATALADIDVIFFDPEYPDTDREKALERRLARSGPELPWPETHWSVRNQARMHLRNGDSPYRSTEHAIMHWLETPTAVAIRLGKTGAPELLAPFGLKDLFDMVLRPTPHAKAHRMDAFRNRIAGKDWPRYWPRLNVVA